MEQKTGTTGHYEPFRRDFDVGDQPVSGHVASFSVSNRVSSSVVRSDTVKPVVSKAGDA